MSESDPIDNLLRGAFAADRDRTPTVAVAEQVMARIRARQRIREITLVSTTLAGLATLLLFLQPGLDYLTGYLTETLLDHLPTDFQANILALTLIAAVGAAWLMVLDEELA
jgi:hypothetical protein